jgi:hypothetical protein
MVLPTRYHASRLAWTSADLSLQVTAADRRPSTAVRR